MPACSSCALYSSPGLAADLLLCSGPKSLPLPHGALLLPLPLADCPLRISFQVLERKGWLGLEEVVRLLNGNEFAPTGNTCSWDRCRGGLGELFHFILCSFQSRSQRRILPGRCSVSS